MEKQVLFNTTTEEAAQDKFNKTTVFLTKFIFGNNFDSLKKVGYVDSYTEDSSISSIIKQLEINNIKSNQRYLFLLFKNKKLGCNQIRDIVDQLIIRPIEIIFSYEQVNDYSIIVVEFPEFFIQDYDNVILGKYSRLTKEFKEGFPVTREVFNSSKEKIGSEYTLYHHIFNKTEWLKKFWMERLGLMDLDPKLEFWTIPEEKDLIFNIKNII